ncbi:hypothetical protein SLEP1_g34528 [Rubroshorea leprosula]|uniref:Uncharacterized protein n=1 Tax=Rubroshorea leprosula TaxID=152421 RepID=A0AAV5KK69_9ROSI|nr:hypothetical protein SLEP1_g34528 [Rubroshorea leprosula]
MMVGIIWFWSPLIGRVHFIGLLLLFHSKAKLVL